MWLYVPAGTVVERVKVEVAPLMVAVVTVANTVPLAPESMNLTTPAAGAADPELDVTVAVKVMACDVLVLSGDTLVTAVVVPVADTGANATPLIMVPAAPV